MTTDDEQVKRRGPTVPENLIKMAELYKQRNSVYGDTFFSFGKVMNGVFNGRPVTIQSVDDWNRIGTLMHVVDKLSRYGSNFDRGGHEDSLNDISVYSQILRFVDQETQDESD